MGIECRLDLWQGSDAPGSDERVGCFVGSRYLQWPMTISREWDLCLRFSRGWAVWQFCCPAWFWQACAAQLDLDPKAVFSIKRYLWRALDACVGFAARFGSRACDLGDRPGTPTAKSRWVLHSVRNSLCWLLNPPVRVPACPTVLGSVPISDNQIPC